MSYCDTLFGPDWDWGGSAGRPEWGVRELGREQIVNGGFLMEILVCVVKYGPFGKKIKMLSLIKTTHLYGDITLVRLYDTYITTNLYY